ncbi:MAG: hypothetical protein NT074_06285 [Methanomicrobiales archaeon]|nr:hypothetical protein [Methanomicrobiales archaeon]
MRRGTKNFPVLVSAAVMVIIIVAALFATGAIQSLLFPQSIQPGGDHVVVASIIAEAIPTDTEVVFLAVPRSGIEGDYFISYELLENGVTLESAANRAYRNLSSAHPFMKRVEKEPGTNYTLTIQVTDPLGKILLEKTLTHEVPRTPVT